jgi:MFS transporter, FHS family, glucose/mannose:H+ symporter
VTALGFTAFMVIAALIAMIGPSLPEIQTHFGIGAAASGLIIGSHFLGTIVGTLLTTALQRYFGLRSRLIWGTGLVTVTSLLLPLMNVWALFLILAGVRGVGSGLLFAEVNELFARGFGTRSTAMLSLVNAAYGIGSFLGPMLLLIAPGNFQIPMVVGGLLCILMIVLAVNTPSVQKDVSQKGVVVPQVSIPREAYPLIGLFILLQLIASGIENTMGTWLATQFIFDGFSREMAATLTALFYAAHTTGRIVCAPLSLRLSPVQLLGGGLLLTVVALVLAHIPPLRVFAYLLAGLGISPSLAVGLIWFVTVLPAVRTATTLGLLGALVGAAVFPPLTGQIIQRYSAQSLPTVLLTLALLGLGLLVALWFQVRRHYALGITPS